VIVGARTQEQLDNALAARDQPLPTEIIARMNAWLDT
jgi:aryl-alcohol dehydrogenase-like predicted oxidoreductase